MSESSSAKIRSKGWSRMPLAAIVALMLAPALISTAARASEVDLKAATSNFSDSCVDCHGQSGKGDGPKAANLSVKVANLTDCAKMGKVSDDVLFTIVKEGGAAANLNKAMAGFADAYDDNEIKGLVAYVRSLCGK
ncbi:c-type cytochrome [Candidatus Binatus sp.]|uniref:c-type cytochrome n=1 Tax=Candidatus Binatus sp. TaxID=2811406 RepID=UPI002F94C7C5